MAIVPSAAWLSNLSVSRRPRNLTLDRRGPLTVGEATEVLGFSQPAVTRTVGALAELALIETRRDPIDSRVKRIQLTPAGETCVLKMKMELWPAVEQAAASLDVGCEASLLEVLGGVEAALRRESLERRVLETQTDLRLVPYRDELAPTFAEITRLWVEEMFTLEPEDRAVVEDPKRHILDRGGEIWFVEAEGLGVVGTCALMPSEGKSFELTKMGVYAEARGRKAGAFLLRAMLERARTLHNRGRMDALFLLTNARCGAAIHLYEKHGFVHDDAVRERFGARYERCDVAMSFPLRDPPPPRGRPR